MPSIALLSASVTSDWQSWSIEPGRSFVPPSGFLGGAGGAAVVPASIGPYEPESVKAGPPPEPFPPSCAEGLESEQAASVATATSPTAMRRRQRRRVDVTWRVAGRDARRRAARPSTNG